MGKNFHLSIHIANNFAYGKTLAKSACKKTTM